MTAAMSGLAGRRMMCFPDSAGRASDVDLSPHAMSVTRSRIMEHRCHSGLGHSRSGAEYYS